MIIDHILHKERYTNISPELCDALDYLASEKHAHLAPGKYELNGEQLFCLVQNYMPKTIAEGKLEAHRRYIDVQYIVSGEEMIGYGDLGQLIPGEYNDAKDFQSVVGNVDLVRVPAGFFMILFPNDVHMPGIQTDSSATMVRKVVMKVKIHSDSEAV